RSKRARRGPRFVLRPDTTSRLAPCRRGADLRIGHDRGTRTTWIPHQSRKPIPAVTWLGAEGLLAMQPRAERQVVAEDLSRNSAGSKSATSCKEQSTRTVSRAHYGRRLA